MTKAEFAVPGSSEWNLAWDHLRRAFPGTDLCDRSDSGEAWEYMGTWFSELANYDNQGQSIPAGTCGPCWNHQFRHRDYQGAGRHFTGAGRLFVNIVADFESIPNRDVAAVLCVGDLKEDEIPF